MFQVLPLLFPQVEKVSKKPVKVHECRSKQVGNSTGLYIVADAYSGGKYIQFMVQKGQGRVLLFTATGKDQDFDTMKSEFDQVMKSFRLM